MNTATDPLFPAPSGLRRSRAISLTPLIDVVFILLLFFMLTSTFIRQKELALSSLTQSADAEAREPQIVEINTQGDYRLRGQALVYGGLQAVVSVLDRESPVVLQPSADASVQLIVTALNELKLEGVETLRLGPIANSHTAAEGGDTQ